MRPAVRAGSFYPAEKPQLLALLERCLEREPPRDAPLPLAALVPHAGWVYSGPTAGLAFRAIARHDLPPDLFLLFGAVHTVHLHAPSIDTEDLWETPLGELEVDRGFLKRLQEAGAVALNPVAHRGEHSIEVLLPFVKKLFPRARIAPIATPPGLEAFELGLAAAEEALRAGRRIVALGSTDLTHYGRNYYGFAPAGEGEAALRWARENDGRLLERICGGQAEEILPEALRSSSACGPGAATALVAFARGMGRTKGFLLEHTDSYEVAKEGKRATDFVGYAAVVF